MVTAARMKASKPQRAIARIYTMKRGMVTLRGTLEPLLVDGKQPTYTRKDKTLVKAPVQLFHSGRVWWLHYEFAENTGGFKSKKDAIHWWVSGGR